MNDATRLRTRRELAERMGYFVATGNGAFWLCFPSGESVGGGGWATEEDAWSDAPDPFTSHADCAALVEWLAVQGEAIQHKFVTCLMGALTGEGWHMVSRGSGMSVHHIMKVLTSPLEARVLAACAALGISTGDK